MLGDSLSELRSSLYERQWRTEGGGGEGGGGGGLGFKPPHLSEISKALQNRAKLNPIVKNVKNC